MYGMGMAAIMATNAASNSSAVYDLPPDNRKFEASYTNEAIVMSDASSAPESINSRNARTLTSASTSACMDENRPYCRSLYEFKGEFDNELSFGAGEIIYLRRRVDDEWLEGELQSGGARAGIFPASFVEIVVDFATPNTSFSSSGGNSSSPSNGCLDSTSSSTTSGVALVTHDFEARYNDELTVRGGDSLKVIEILDENWAKCQHSVSGDVGIVPQSYLQIFLENEPADNSLDSVKATNGSNITATSNQGEVAPDLPWNVDWDNSTASLANNSTIDAGKSTKAPSFVPEIEIPKKKLHPPLPPVKALEEESKALDQPKASRQQPPQRPPLPSNFSLSSASTSSSSERRMSQVGVPQIVGPNRPPVDFQEQKMKIIQDLLTTETTYLFDLNSWEACISSSTSLSDENKKILNHGFPQLKELSKKLIDNIQIERAKAPEAQCYGQVLMFMKEDFYRTFSHHCRTVEKIGQILENMSDAGLKAALNHCVAEMRKMGSNVFDAPTALSRPIHRCLKYPLYVGELLKNTPINHIDHPKLMESLKQLGNLASKMNECKRRKELIRKYTDDQQLTLAERLSRINVHSLVKKSNRLKYRISSTMGFNTIRDSEFDYLITQLDSAERRICKFLYCAQLYKKNIEIAFKKYEDVFRGPTSIEDERVMKVLCEFLEQFDKIRKNFLDTFENSFLNEGRKLVRSDYTKLIHKRCDKLADYETAKTTNKNPNETEMRRNEYEALNNQVKSVMPKLITNINKKVGELVHGISENDTKLVSAVDALLFQQRQSQDKCAFFSDAPMFSNFVSTTLGGNRFTEMNRIIRSMPHSSSSTENSVADNVALKVQGNRIVTRRTASVKSKKSKPLTQKLSGLSMRQKSVTANAARAQTLKERDALIKIIRAQGTSGVLRRVTANYSVDNMLLNVGDVVLVKSHKNGKCECDNGVALGYVPHEYLQPFDDELVESTGSVPLLNLSPTGPTANNVTPQRPQPASVTSLFDDSPLFNLSPVNQPANNLPMTSSNQPMLSNNSNAGGLDFSGIENLKHFRL